MNLEIGKLYKYDSYEINNWKIRIVGKSAAGRWVFEEEDGDLGTLRDDELKHLIPLEEEKPPVVIDFCLVFNSEDIVPIKLIPLSEEKKEQGRWLIDKLKARYDSSKPLKERIQVIEE